MNINDRAAAYYCQSCANGFETVHVGDCEQCLLVSEPSEIVSDDADSVEVRGDSVTAAGPSQQQHPGYYKQSSSQGFAFVGILADKPLRREGETGEAQTAAREKEPLILPSALSTSTLFAFEGDVQRARLMETGEAAAESHSNDGSTPTASTAPTEEGHREYEEWCREEDGKEDQAQEAGGIQDLGPPSPTLLGSVGSVVASGVRTPAGASSSSSSSLPVTIDIPPGNSLGSLASPVQHSPTPTHASLDGREAGSGRAAGSCGSRVLLDAPGVVSTPPHRRDSKAPREEIEEVRDDPTHPPTNPNPSRLLSRRRLPACLSVCLSVCLLRRGHPPFLPCLPC